MAFIGEPWPMNSTGILCDETSAVIHLALARIAVGLHLEHKDSDEGLLQVGFVGVVVEAEAQRQVWSRELVGKRGKRVGCRDASPGWPVEGDIARRKDQPHICNLSLFRDCEFDR